MLKFVGTPGRVRRRMDRLRASGLRPVQIWVPDTHAPGFAEACTRQAKLIRRAEASAAENEAWAAVSAAGHPAVGLAVDTFHLLARGDDASALTAVPGDRIAYLQVADAPYLSMDVLEWSRHHRCFPGQGSMDVVGVVSAVLEAGYRGPLSLEVFSDIVREAAPQDTARSSDGLVSTSGSQAPPARSNHGRITSTTRSRSTSGWNTPPLNRMASTPSPAGTCWRTNAARCFVTAGSAT